MADHFEEDRIRSGLAVLVDEAPLAPEFDELTTTRARPIEQRKPRPLVAAGLSAFAVLAVFFVGAIWMNQGGAPSGVSAETPEVPSEVLPTATTLADLEPGEFPRVLPGVDGWTVSYIDDSEGVTAEGEYAVSDVQFTDGSVEVELRMASGWHADFAALVADRLTSADRLDDAVIWDTTATVARTGDTSFIAIWESNSVEYEFVVYETDETSFRELLGSLIQMPEEEWISALSDEIVVDRAQAVATYLSDVPIPPGLDTSSVEDGPIEHWYQVAGQTISAVSCAWIDSWIDAKSAGDTQAVQSAVDAMSSSHDWQILKAMDAEGDYPNAVWEYADAMAGDGVVAAGDPEHATVEASYQRAFGCDN